jgi:hypothetical protein
MKHTALQKRTITAVRKWCKDSGLRLVNGVSHVHPRAYVVARVAPSCLIVSVPDCDREPQVRGMDKFNRCDTIHKFDSDLEQGDWCSTAYVSTPSSGEKVAIKVQA